MKKFTHNEVYKNNSSLLYFYSFNVGPTRATSDKKEVSSTSENQDSSKTSQEEDSSTSYEEEELIKGKNICKLFSLSLKNKYHKRGDEYYHLQMMNTDVILEFLEVFTVIILEKTKGMGFNKESIENVKEHLYLSRMAEFKKKDLTLKDFKLNILTFEKAMNEAAKKDNDFGFYNYFYKKLNQFAFYEVNINFMEYELYIKQLFKLAALIDEKMKKDFKNTLSSDIIFGYNYKNETTIGSLYTKLFDIYR